MKRFFRNLSYKLRLFLQGRYGADGFSNFLIALSMISVLISYFKPLRFMYALGLALMAFAVFRFLSKNYDKRYAELRAYQNIISKPKAFLNLAKNKWRDRKTHRYYKCKNCKATLRVPKGRGKIEITCPKCKTKVIKKV